MVALGLADPEVLPLVENALSRVNVTHYNPEGRLRHSERFFALLSALAALVRAPAFEAVAGLARCPDFLACLAARSGPGFSAAGFLKELDELRARRLPADLATARAMMNPKNKHLAHGLDVIEEVHAALTDGEFSSGAIAALTLIFRDRRLDLKRTEEARALLGLKARVAA